MTNKLVEKLDNTNNMETWSSDVMNVSYAGTCRNLEEDNLYNNSKSKTPNVILTSVGNVLQLTNDWSKELILIGFNFPDIIEFSVKEEHIILPLKPAYLEIFTDQFKDKILSIIGDNGERLVPFEIYLLDYKNLSKERKFTAKFYLLCIAKNGELEIHTQNLGTEICNKTIGMTAKKLLGFIKG